MNDEEYFLKLLTALRTLIEEEYSPLMKATKNYLETLESVYPTLGRDNSWLKSEICVLESFISKNFPETLLKSGIIGPAKKENEAFVRFLKNLANNKNFLNK
ncbi:MAG: hypothetical protein VYD54_14500 [Bdellovibrionota bacterium]|nr:hypothetical protein [Bdellovibrionota bacterium]